MSEDLLYCPTRKRTNPVKITTEDKSNDSTSVIKPSETSSNRLESENVATEESINQKEPEKINIDSVNTKCDPKAEVQPNLSSTSVDKDLDLSDSEDEMEIDNKEIVSATLDSFDDDSDDHDNTPRFNKFESVERSQQKENINTGKDFTETGTLEVDKIQAARTESDTGRDTKENFGFVCSYY